MGRKTCVSKQATPAGSRAQALLLAYLGRPDMIKDITTTTAKKKKKQDQMGIWPIFTSLLPGWNKLIKEAFNRNEALVPKYRLERRKQEY